jgi:uncharacterized repeat protein (TIGR01451 family)
MSNELKSHPGTMSLPSRVVAVVGLILIVSLAIGLPAFAQDDPAFVRQVRTIETDEIGAINPAGLAFSPVTNAFHVVEVRGQVRLPGPFSDIISIRPAGDRVGPVRVWAATADPINMAYDAQANRLLLYQSAAEQLLEMAAGPDGRLDPAMLTRTDARRFALQNPQGMTVDPESGDLFFLDSAGPRIVRIEPTPDGGFGDGQITQADLAQADLSDLRGLAFNPANGHLYVLSRAEQTLYELTQAGHVVAMRDISAFRLNDPQSMVFAPSGDLTDDPSLLSLYVADSGLVVGQERGTASPTGGQIIELSFVQPAAPAAADFVAQLVQTIDTSLFLPPSPDPAGIAYVGSSNTLMVCDSEVNEMSIFTGENLFRVRPSGDLFDTLTTIGFTSEPTGVTYNPDNKHLFFSDDIYDEVYELDPGPDGLYDTGDDIVTSFDTRAHGSEDPEGLAFSRATGALFIVDGVNAEVYQVTPGPDGLFNGVNDGWTNFDTAILGVTDPEGIGLNPENGHLYMVGDSETTLVETTTDGTLVQTTDISVANAVRPTGLAYGPSSLDPDVPSIYITDLGIDNFYDPYENDGKIYEMTLPPPTGSLAIVKEVEPASALAGEVIAYTLSFSNDGDDTATGVTITDIIPVSVTVQSVTNSGAAITDTGATPRYVWQVENLSPGEGGVINITAELSPTLICGNTIANTASITATTGDSDPGDNSSNVSLPVGRGVVVTPPTADKSGNVGTDVVYSLSVENTGSCADTFDLAVSGNVWPVSAPATVGSLDPGESDNVLVTVTIPPDARCGADFATITLTSQHGGTVSDSSMLTTSANAFFGVTVEPSSNVDSADPGAVVTHTLQVTNIGNCADSLNLSLTGNLWTTGAPATVGPLAGGMSASVDVTVTVPADAQFNDADTVIVTLAFAGNGTILDSSTLTSMANAVYGVTVEPPSHADWGDPGAVVIHTLQVTNTGNDTDTFNLALSGDEWTTVAPATVGPLAPGEGADVGVTVTVPLQAWCEAYDSANVTLTSQGDGSVSGSSDLTTSANAVYSVTVLPPSDADWGDQEAEVVYHLSVVNSGNCTDTFDGTVSGNAWSTVVPDPVGPVAAGDIAYVDVTVTVPADAQCVDDIATVTYTSQGESSLSDSSILTTTASAFYGVTVEPPSDLAWGDPGDKVVHALWVTNTGNCADTIDLALSGDEWTTVAPVTVLELAGGVGASLDVTVTVPADAQCGDEDIATVTFTSRHDDSTSDESSLTTLANTVRGVAVEPSSDAASGDPGTNVAYSLQVTNTGNCDDTFDVSASGDAWTTVAVPTVAPLGAGTGASVDVTVSVPACTEGGASDPSAVVFTSQNDGTLSKSAMLTTTTNYVAPVAIDDDDLMLEDTVLVWAAPGVLENDDDANCDPLSAGLEAAPANGTVVLEADGSFTYTPNLNFYGEDSFTYSASDGALADTATFMVTVLSAGDDPIVDAGDDQTVDEGETVSFTGSFVDPARQILFDDESIHWDFGDGNTAIGTLTPTHQYRDSALYAVTLTVTDSSTGEVGHDSLLVTVRNVAPTVNAGPDQLAVPGKPLSLSGDFFDPGLDDTHSIEWDLDDGTIIPDTLAFDHTYVDSGVYTVTLTVIDDDGGEGSDTAVISAWYRPYLPLISRAYTP